MERSKQFCALFLHLQEPHEYLNNSTLFKLCLIDDKHVKCILKLNQQDRENLKL